MNKNKIDAEEIYLASEENEAEESIGKAEDSFGDDAIALEVPIKEERRVSEIPELRESNKKVFRMKDGTEQAIFYAEPIHVLNEETNGFEDVDNTILEDEERKQFVNGKNRFKAKFSRENDNDELFSIESGVHRVVVSAKKNKKQRNQGIGPKKQKKNRENFNEVDILF